jgi:probable HAF family extracellular repeat protein
MKIVLALILFLTFAALSVSAEVRYSLTPLYVTGTSEAFGGAGINNLGQIVGAVYDAQQQQNRAAVWENGSVQYLDSGTAVSSSALYINEAGQIAGGFTPPGAGSGEQACLWQNGEMQSLNTLGATVSYAEGLNSHGQIAGTAYDDHSKFAFLWESGTMTRLSLGDNVDSSEGYDINDSGVIVGRLLTWSDERYLAYTYQDGILTMLPEGQGAAAINNNGWIVGQSTAWRAAIWRNNVMTDLGVPSVTDLSSAIDVNEHGQVTGYYVSGTVYTAFLWDNGSMYDLNSLIPQNSGWRLLTAGAINDRGQILAVGERDGNLQSLLLNPVPEPSSFLAMACGLAGLGGLMRRRQKK